MLSQERIDGLAKEAVRRLAGRTGRTFKGADKMRRELDAAGRTGRQDHGLAFSYPRGTAVNPAPKPEEEGDSVESSRQSGVL